MIFVSRFNKNKEPVVRLRKEYMDYKEREILALQIVELLHKAGTTYDDALMTMELLHSMLKNQPVQSYRECRCNTELVSAAEHRINFQSSTE